MTGALISSCEPTPSLIVFFWRALKKDLNQTLSKTPNDTANIIFRPSSEYEQIASVHPILIITGEEGGDSDPHECFKLFQEWVTWLLEKLMQRVSSQADVSP